MSLIWYCNNVLMPSPSTYKISWEDLDNDSYRSVTNGNLIRNVIKRRWAKVSMSWSVLPANKVNQILSAVNQDGTYFRFKSPAFSNGFITFAGYVSKMETELLEGMIGYSLSFNVVQSESAAWQGSSSMNTLYVPVTRSVEINELRSFPAEVQQESRTIVEENIELVEENEEHNDLIDEPQEEQEVENAEVR